MTVPGMTHLSVIGEPGVPACGWTGGAYFTEDLAQVTCDRCPESWAYAVATRRAAIPAHWQPVSVEPAANFTNEHGLLAVSDSGQPDQVIIEQASRLVYILDDWVELAKRGSVPWAEIGYVNQWRCVLKIQGTGRTVVYEDTGGGCGWRVKATIFQQPD